MEIKKSKKANIDDQRGKAFLLGLVIALSLVFASLEYTFSPDRYIGTDYIPDDVLEEMALTPALEPEDMVAATTEEKPAAADKVKAVETLSKDATNTIDENSLMLIGEADALLAEANTDQAQPQVPALAQDTTVLRTTDKLPEFPGGITEFMKWLTKNLRYPEQARSNKIQGKVVVSFIVNKDGSISSPTVQKSVDPLLDREALRVIRMMPHWKPGIMDSKPCRTMFAIPVVFNL